VGLDPARLRIASGLPNPAFTIGWFRPRVYVAESLASRLSTHELEALLSHEAAHVGRRDPLRLSAMRFLALLLFWIPALRRLADDVANEAEIQADDVAARTRPLALASALVALAQDASVGSGLPDVVAFSQGARLFERRIRRLAGESPAPNTSVTRRSILGALLALSLVTLSGAVMVHPLPVGEGGHTLTHCNHEHEHAVSHLFCFPASARLESALCPHGRRSG
jgi:beta-lactamase regulating signal transducer with metallopeptidase domain